MSHIQSGSISTLKIPDVDTLRADLDGQATARNTHHVHIGPFRRMVDGVRYGTALVPRVVSRCFAGHHINIGRGLRRMPGLILLRVVHRLDLGVHQLVNPVFRSRFGQMQDGSLFAGVDRNHRNTRREFIRNEPFVGSALQESARADELPCRLGVRGREPGRIEGDCQLRRWRTEAVDRHGLGTGGRRGNRDDMIWLAAEPFRVTLFDLNARDQILTNEWRLLRGCVGYLRSTIRLHAGRPWHCVPCGDASVRMKFRRMADCSALGRLDRPCCP